MRNMLSPAQEKLRFVDHMSLNDMASYLEVQAETLRLQAANQQSNSDSGKQAAAMDHLIRTPRVVMRHLNKGMTLDSALEMTANDTGAPIVAIKRAWTRFTHDKSLYEMRRRNRLILELAAMGFTNSEIGKRVNLHCNSVSRIIAQARKAYHKGSQSSLENVGLLLKSGSIF